MNAGNEVSGIHSFTLGLEYLGLHRRPMIDYFSYLLLNKILLHDIVFPLSFYNLRCLTANSERHSEFFSSRRVSVVC